ncbi:MAG: PDZ domain-containing protein, partial [Anaerolineae bacterium]|nr:PDZ domain-containing protein [Anaerolineae bacterium]
LRGYLNKLTADEVVLTILRAGETQELTVPAAALDALNIFGLNFGDQSFQIPFGSMMGMSGVRLGVEFLVLDDQVAAENNVSQTEGALLTTIIDGSPAATAGLKVNDIITAVDGDKVDQERTLRDRLLAYEPGDTVTLSVLRGDETLDVEVTLEQVAMSDLMPFFEGSGFNFQFPQPPQPAQPLLEGAAL